MIPLFRHVWGPTALEDDEQEEDEEPDEHSLCTAQRTARDQRDAAQVGILLVFPDLSHF